MAIAELRQTARGSWQALLLIVPAVVLAVIVPVEVSAAIVLFGLLPQLAAALRLGMLKEEYEGPPLRYFWGWPVSRMGLWGIKAASVGAFLLLTAALALPVVLWRSGGAAPSWAGPGGWPLLAVGCVALCLYSWGAGAVAMAACRTSKPAGALVFPPLWAGTITGAVLFVSAPDPWGKPLAVGLVLAGAAVLLGGALWVHRVRNPFLERVWLWRGIAGGSILATLGLLAAVGVGALGVAGFQNLQLPAGGGEGVAHHELAPDGRTVRVSMRDGRTLVLGADGSERLEVERGFPLQAEAFFAGLDAEPQRVLVTRQPSLWSAFQGRPDGGLVQLGPDGTAVLLWRPEAEEGVGVFGAQEPNWMAFDPAGPRLLGVEWSFDGSGSSLVELTWPGDAAPVEDPREPVGRLEVLLELPGEASVERVWPNGDLAVYVEAGGGAAGGEPPARGSFYEAATGRWHPIEAPGSAERAWGTGGVWDPAGGRTLYRLEREVGEEAVDWVLRARDFPSGEVRTLGEPVRSRSIREAAAGGEAEDPQLMIGGDGLLWVGFYGFGAAAGPADPGEDPLLFDTAAGAFLGRVERVTDAGVASGFALSRGGGRLAVTRVEEAEPSPGFGGFVPPGVTLEVWPMPADASAGSRLGEGEPERSRRVAQAWADWLPDGRLLFVEPAGGVPVEEEPQPAAADPGEEPSLAEVMEEMERMNPPVWLRTLDPATGEEAAFGPEP